MSARRVILLVEDNPRDIELTIARLVESGVDAEVVVLNDGEQALDYLYRRGQFRLRGPEEPFIIFLDIKMPKVSGLEVLENLRKNAQWLPIPVVLITSSREEQDLARAYEFGADGYLIKPVKAARLPEVIESSIRAAAARVPR